MLAILTPLRNFGAIIQGWFIGSPPEQRRARRKAPEPARQEVQDAVVVAPEPVPQAKLNQRHPTLWRVQSSDKRRKTWCGPTAVSAITGIDPAEVHRVIQHSRGGKAVMGTYPHELELALNHFGYRLVWVEDRSADPPTLATWERERADMEAAYIVMVTGHWVAVRGRWFCDTFTRGEPVPIKKAPRRRKRVQHVYKVVMRG
ncbi:MAG: hypothetical protein RLZ98_2519 [Pseudomonadota bacterium]|jgi:hypothetical protein